MNRLNTQARWATMSLALCTATALQAQERIRAGMWESTVISSGRTATRSTCMDASVVSQSNGPAAKVRAETEKAIANIGSCKLTDLKLDDTSLVMDMTCAKRNVHQVTMFHGGDSFETTSTTTDAGQPRVSQIRSHRTGACEAGAAP